MTPFDKANNLLSVCVAQGRITEIGHASYLSSATTHYDNTLAILAELAATRQESTDPRQWGFAKLQHQAPEQLEAMRQQEPNRYQALKDLYVAELKAKDDRPHRKPPLPIGPTRLPKGGKSTPASEFARMQREEPAALQKLRKEDPAKYDRLKQEHVEKIKQAK